MDLDLILKITYIVLPVVGGAIAYFIREQLTRISKLESDFDTLSRDIATGLVTKEDLRVAIADKIEPIREDIAEIKSKLDKLYEFFVKVITNDRSE